LGELTGRFSRSEFFQDKLDRAFGQWRAGLVEARQLIAAGVEADVPA
jgi:hypothetical protein